MIKITASEYIQWKVCPHFDCTYCIYKNSPELYCPNCLNPDKTRVRLVEQCRGNPPHDIIYPARYCPMGKESIKDPGLSCEGCDTKK